MTNGQHAATVVKVISRSRETPKRPQDHRTQESLNKVQFYRLSSLIKSTAKVS